VLTSKQASDKPGRRTLSGGSDYRRTSNSIIIFIFFFSGLFNGSLTTTSNSYLELKSSAKTLQ